MCKVEGCSRKSQYKEQDVCQMHYFRYMRNGTYDLTRSRRYRVSNPAGYQKLYEPSHYLANSDGCVYEHRFIYFNKISSNPRKCEKCGEGITWNDLHIDHIDNDVTNNKADNLRALCRSCNVFRGHTSESMGSYMLTIDGKTMSATAWARMPGVKVSSGTIRRRKKLGMSDYDSVYAPRVTHCNTKTKRYKTKYDKERGIIE